MKQVENVIFKEHSLTQEKEYKIVEITVYSH